MASLPTPEEFDTLPFVEQIRLITSVLPAVIDGYRRHLIVRQYDGRSLSATDTKNLRALAMAMEALLLESREHLAPGSIAARLDAVIAELADTPPPNHPDTEVPN